MAQWKTQTYVIELSAAMALYAILLIGSNMAERYFHPRGGVLIAINVLPIAGALSFVWVIVRAFDRMDELQRRIQFDALVLAFAGTAVGSFSWGFLEGVGVPQLRAFMVWPMMAMLWVVGLILATRRYSR